MSARPFFAVLALAVPVHARAGDSALDALNAYLIDAARTHAAYRAGVVAGDAPDGPAPGRFLGWSARIGPFTYRVRSYSELSPQERAAVLADPAWRAFASTRRPPANRTPPVERIALAPEDMLRTEPLVLPWPPP